MDSKATTRPAILMIGELAILGEFLQISLARSERKEKNSKSFSRSSLMPPQYPRSIGVDSNALSSQLIVSPMQENEAHDLSVVIPPGLTAPVAVFVLGGNSVYFIRCTKEWWKILAEHNSNVSNCLHGKSV